MPKKQRDGKRGYLSSSDQRSGRRKRWQWIIISAIVLVVVVAAGVGGWSYYNFRVKPYKQVAIKVNDVAFDMRYYINMLKIYYGKVHPGYLADYSDYGDQEIEQFAGYVEHQIVQNETIKQGSSAFGVQVERGDIEAELKKSGTPVTNERIDILTAQKLVEKQVPSTQQQAHVQAMLLESEGAAQEAKARLEAGESFEQVANDLSKIPSSAIVDGDMGWITAREADLTVGSEKFGDVLFGADIGVLSGPVYDDAVLKQFGYWVMKVVDRKEATDTAAATVHVQGILVASEQEANDVRDKLNAGADIDELAKQVSQMPGAETMGAELGWMTKSEDNGEFDALFDLPLNAISEPIGDNQAQTKGGYWVLNILEKDDNRALTTDQKNMLEKDLLDRLGAEIEKDPDYKVENLLTEEMRIFALNEVVSSLGEGAVIIRTSSLPDAETGIPYYQKIEVYGNTKGNTWTITQGNLLAGLSLNESTGVISGIPEVAGGTSFTVEVSSGTYYWKQEFVMRVHFPISVTTTSLPDAQVGVSYSAILEVFGDYPSYTWSIIDGSLPDGLSLSETSGYIFGTPAAAGSYTFTVEVDSGLSKATQELSLYVSAESSSDS